MPKRKNNLTNTCATCNKPCSRNAKRCELCARPNRMPQRKDVGITVTNTNIVKVIGRAIERVKDTKV